MQIHEITRPAINEAFGDTLRTIGRNLKTSADFALRGDEKAGAAMLKQQTDQYVNSLIPQWKATWAKEEPAVKQKMAQPQPAATPGPDTTPGTKYGDPITTASGEVISKPGDPSYDTLAKKAGLKEATTTVPGLADEYVKQFQAWAGQVLSTKESNTRRPIDANKFSTALSNYSNKIKDAYNANNSVLLDQAIKEYLMAQVGMVQAEAKEIRDEYLASIRKGERIAVTGISKDQLEKLADTIEKRGETVRPTGSETIDSLLRAGGIIR